MDDDKTNANPDGKMKYSSGTSRYFGNKYAALLFDVRKWSQQHLILHHFRWTPLEADTCYRNAKAYHTDTLPLGPVVTPGYKRHK